LDQTTGYDGQFYYRLALNPWSTQSVEFGITLDSPAYRDQRLLYPLIVWAASLGRSSLVPGMLIAVNYASLCLIALFSAQVVRAFGQHSLWGLTIPLYPGFLFTVARDLTEIVEICLLLAGLCLLCSKKTLLASLSLSGAVLARETAVVFVAAKVIEEIVGGRRKAALWLREPKRYFQFLLLLLPLAVFGCWQASLLYRWGALPFNEGQDNLGLPLAGLVGYAASSVLPALGSQRLWIVEISFVVAVTVLAAWSIRNTVVPLSQSLSWTMYLLLASTLTGLVWNDDWAFFRVLSELHVFGALAIARSTTRLKFGVLIATAALWLYLARQVVLRDACP